MGELLLLLGVFAGALAIGYILISRVPPLLHTPLMSLTNAVSAVTILGALLVFARADGQEPAGAGLALAGGVAVAMAMFNVLGGFVITDRMLRLFKKR